MGSSDAPDPDPNTAKINSLTLKRLQREEKDLAKSKSEKQRLLASGRVGRISLLTSGFTGPKAGAPASASSASTRAAERTGQKATAEFNRTHTVVPNKRGKGGSGFEVGSNSQSPAEAAKIGAAGGTIVPFSPEQWAFLQSREAQLKEPEESPRYPFGGDF